ncbi:MAG: RNA polymerase subunit sigma-24, partial [Phototrophicales bacterium]
YDELRRTKRRPQTYLEDLAPEDSDDEPPIPSAADTPEQVAEQSDLQRAIQHCIGNLKDDQRIVLVLSDVQGMSYQEIADSTDTQIGTVKSRLSRARLAVRNCLQGFSELLPDQYRL